MQVKEANKLIKNTRKKKKFKGVPVFTAQNLDLAIATADGIMWYLLFNHLLSLFINH